MKAKEKDPRYKQRQNKKRTLTKSRVFPQHKFSLRVKQTLLKQHAEQNTDKTKLKTERQMKASPLFLFSEQLRALWVFVKRDMNEVICPQNARKELL